MGPPIAQIARDGCAGVPAATTALGILGSAVSVYSVYEHEKIARLKRALLANG